MNYLSDLFNHTPIKLIGFDLDGTLYDEFDFIDQTYDQIVHVWGVALEDSQATKDWMLRRWLEKGSSYPFIFDEALDNFGKPEVDKIQMIQKALKVFRETKPELKLSRRTVTLLQDIGKQYKMFLLTDGSKRLQGEKIESLELKTFFNPDNILISGIFGKEYQKPSTLIIEEIQKRFPGIQPFETIYIGDRKRDKEFAQNVGFEFVYIQDLFKLMG